MKRNDWTVNYSGSELLEAAQAKIEFHTSRETWWKEKKESLMITLRTSGVHINETIVDELSKGGYANTMSAFHRSGPRVELDEELVSKLEEASLKVKEHTEKIKGYQAWEQMLARNTGAPFPVSIDDWVYFFGK